MGHGAGGDDAVRRRRAEVRGSQGTSGGFGREIDRGFSRGDVSLERARAVLCPTARV